MSSTGGAKAGCTPLVRIGAGVVRAYASARMAMCGILQVYSGLFVVDYVYANGMLDIDGKRHNDVRPRSAGNRE